MELASSYPRQGGPGAEQWNLAGADGRAGVTACRWETWSIPQDRSGHDVEQSKQQQTADRSDCSQQLDKWSEGNRETGHEEFLKGRHGFVLDRPLRVAL